MTLKLLQQRRPAAKMLGVCASKLVNCVLKLTLCLLLPVSGSEGPSYRYIPDGVVRVTAVLVEPYLMHTDSWHEQHGGRPYTGYIADLVEKISQVAGFDYMINEVDGNSYGYKQADGTWDGMIGELLREESDLAAAPMYSTEQRARVVTFTDSFLSVHATLLLRKPPSGTSLNIQSIDDLLSQSEIQYGTLDKGIIVRAFKQTNSTLLRILWRNMMRFEPSVFTASNQDGIDRVRSEKYGFIIPHTIGEYMSMREPCDLVTVDRFLMNRGYVFAVPKKSKKLLAQVNSALSILRENG